MEHTNLFAQALKSQPLTITAECLPPNGADATAVRKLAASLPKTVSAVVVASNHEEIRACALAFAVLLKQEKIEPVLPLVTRDMNRIALQSDALGAAMLGVGNLLCLSGDHQSLGVSPQSAGAFDLDPTQTILALKGLRDDGALLGGQRVSPPPALFLGAIAHPHLAPMKLNLIQTEKKVAAGAQFLFTQPLWDLASFGEWMGLICKAGLHEKTAIVASVRPLESVAQAEALFKKHASSPVPAALLARMRKASDPAKEGLTICAELASKVKGLQGVRGIHILSGGREETLGTILEQAGLTRA
jgi:methylenetetrahydrofolate reductase (NADPH)